MALSKMTSTSFADNAVLGKFITKITASNDATVSFGSSSITDDFDIYDVVFHKVTPTVNGTIFCCRFGLDGASGLSTGSTDYGYVSRTSWLATPNNGYSYTFSLDSNDNKIALHSLHGYTDLGTGNGSSFSGHFRFHHLRSTEDLVRKTVTNMDLAMQGRYAYVGTFMNDRFMGAFASTSPVNGFTTKVDEISFHMLSGNINTGTLSLYGIKL